MCDPGSGNESQRETRNEELDKTLTTGIIGVGCSCWQEAIDAILEIIEIKYGRDADKELLDTVMTTAVDAKPDIISSDRDGRISAEADLACLRPSKAS